MKVYATRGRVRDRAVFLAGAMVVVGMVAAVLVSAIAYNRSEATVTAKVIDKERIVESGGNGGATSRYLIFAEGETFQNVDSVWHWKFNSSDIYGAIRREQTCTFKVVGWRIPLFSTYRNIISASCQGGTA